MVEIDTSLNLMSNKVKLDSWKMERCGDGGRAAGGGMGGGEGRRRSRDGWMDVTMEDVLRDEDGEVVGVRGRRVMIG